ncbi:uncharacterized protein LOC102713989 [Oryza brachyantha]|uniref:uncharacterized protein LOC102713989 n=1 Tax=Oryza brachyantha TaxID=4533 RepID=UPI000776321D|nr:uncharacterized protein LOC102713989 [Oryza brachyantha]
METLNATDGIRIRIVMINPNGLPRCFPATSPDLLTGELCYRLEETVEAMTNIQENVATSDEDMDNNAQMAGDRRMVKQLQLDQQSHGGHINSAMGNKKMKEVVVAGQISMDVEPRMSLQSSTQELVEKGYQGGSSTDVAISDEDMNRNVQMEYDRRLAEQIQLELDQPRSK